MEAELRDASTRLEAILGSADIGTWTWDIVKDVVIADRNLSNLFGVPHSATGDSVAEFFKAIHPEDFPRMRDILDRSMSDPNADFDVDYRIIQPDETVRWVTARGAFQRVEGRPVFMSGVIIDITSRKKAEMERDILLEREREARQQADELNERLNFSLSSLQLGDWNWDATTDVIALSDRTADIYGVPPGNGMTRTTMREVLHPEDREQARAAAFEAVATHSDYVIEYRVNHPTRGLRWVAARGRPVFDSGGTITGMMGVVQDITEKRAQEQSVIALSSKLRAQTEHFEATLSNLNDFVYSFDREGRVTYANRSLLKLWQQASVEEVYGKSFYDLGYPDDLAKRHLGEIAKVIATKQPHIGETPYLTPTGEWVFFQYIFSPIFDETGEVSAIAGTTRDTTERKKTEIALAAAREQLQRHAETLEATVTERTAKLQDTIGELEAFSYSVSHDMRAPLRAMQGYADAMIEDYGAKLEEDALSYLLRIRKNAERLELLVRDILTYSRVSKEDIKLTSVSLQAFLDNLVPQLPSLQNSGAEVRFHGTDITILAHEAYLSQIFTNLLGNAAKFVSSGRKPEIDVTAQNGGAFVKITVKDNGLGIAREHFERIFNIFGRVYPDKKFEGTGIGLSIVKKAVQRMGGTLGVESTLGEGSSFWFTVKTA